jgi:deoxyribodipyrimidine photolyase-related protein
VGHTALILGDQLRRDNPALEGADRVLFVEALRTLRRHRYHHRRAQLVLSGMRHFAAELREQGVEVVYEAGAESFAMVLDRFDDVVCMEPNAQATRDALEARGVRFVPTTQFLTQPEAFRAWAADRRRLVMEDFYREQRRRFGVLLTDEDEPEGGRWNFDRENRRPPPKDGLDVPDPWLPEEDAIDLEVHRDLERWDLGLWGEPGPREFAVTPAEADDALADFVARRLPEFGPWQDAMVPGERILFHAKLSVPLNLGVLDPLVTVRAAEAAYRRGDAPLNSVEGFVRQVIGWREYVWGMYWLRVREWPERNALGATLELPDAYWGQETGWNCLDTVVGGVQADGYAHHIERLMVLGAIGLTSGVVPWDLVRWFQTAFVDGAEWVMAPNAAGMALFADGGEMMTKPYAAGGNYINKMSGHCKGCRFRPNEKHGDEACPVTALYWDFVARHEELMGSNRRTQRAVGTWNRFAPETREAVRARAELARRELTHGAAQERLA